MTDSASLARRLMRAHETAVLATSLPENVEVFEDSPVTAYHDGVPIHLDCDAGTITTNGLLLTTNLYTPALGKFGERIFPLFLFASLTRPLTESEVDALGGAPHWGIVPAHPAGTTVRRTIDHRILIRKDQAQNALSCRVVVDNRITAEDNHRPISELRCNRLVIHVDQDRVRQGQCSFD